jgi:hypothetical protein
VLQSAPTVQEEKDSQNPEPGGLHPDGQDDKAHQTDETYDGGNQQAAGTS